MKRLLRRDATPTRRYAPSLAWRWLAGCLAGLLASLGLALAPGALTSLAAAPAGGTTLYFPSLTRPFFTNPSFEGGTEIDYSINPPCRYTGFTDGNGNQHPPGWDWYSPDTGVTLPFPTKRQEGSLVPAISGGRGEYVHKCMWQLPSEEYPGGPRALVLDGYWTYKAFSDHIPEALVLSQVLRGTPGAHIRIVAYILGETFDQPTGNNGQLEDDHFIASVQLGSAADTRFYNVMKNNHDIPGNERAWNRFQVDATLPGSGQLNLQVIVQQNWAGRTDFFMDGFSGEVSAGP